MRNGNLNVLKQLWEQPSAVTTETQSRPQETHRQHFTTTSPVDSSDQLNARNQEPSDLNREPSSEPLLENKSDQVMEKWMHRDVETPVVSSIPIEKPAVPLNSLKMMFEKGEGQQNKVSTMIIINSLDM